MVHNYFPACLFLRGFWLHMDVRGSDRRSGGSIVLRGVAGLHAIAGQTAAVPHCRPVLIRCERPKPGISSQGGSIRHPVGDGFDRTGALSGAVSLDQSTPLYGTLSQLLQWSAA